MDEEERQKQIEAYIDTIWVKFEEEIDRSLLNGFRVACLVLGEHIYNSDPYSPRDYVMVIEDFFEKYPTMPEDELKALIVDKIKNKDQYDIGK